MIDDHIRLLINDAVLCWLATSSTNAEPSVSPKEVFAAFGDRSIIIANIASPGSARNIRDNPRACVSFIDIFTQRGYQIAGPAEILGRDHTDFSEAESVLLKMTQGDYPFKTIFRVHADRIKPVVAPRYRLFPDTTEQQQIDSAMRAYGVMPRHVI